MVMKGTAIALPPIMRALCTAKASLGRLARSSRYLIEGACLGHQAAQPTYPDGEGSSSRLALGMLRGASGQFRSDQAARLSGSDMGKGKLH